MTLFRILRGKFLSGMLDMVCLVLFGLTAVLAVFSKRVRNDALHAFTRNFWGTRGPVLDGRPVVWFHAISLGEMRICQPLLSFLATQRSDLQFVLSVGTSDAMSVARNELPTIALFYAPFDFSWAVRQTFDLVNPIALVISENDFWAQMLNEAQRRTVRLAIFNTRMSPREQREHRWNAWLLRPGLAHAAWWGAVTDADANWIRHFFGVTSPPLEVTGSIKFDGRIRDPQNARSQELRKKLGFSSNHQILVAGSTHDTEEKLIANIANRLAIDFPNLRVVIAPRSASRGDEVFHSLQREFRSAILYRGEALPESTTDSLITVVNSIGVLQDLWGLADLVFVGGSLVRHGGQNMVEPASYGKPVCFGPHVWNFEPIVLQLLSADAAKQVKSEVELEATFRNWLTNPDIAQEMGDRAKEIVRTQLEPLRRTIAGILSILPAPAPRADRISIMMETSQHSHAPAEAS